MIIQTRSTASSMAQVLAVPKVLKDMSKAKSSLLNASNDKLLKAFTAMRPAVFKPFLALPTLFPVYNTNKRTEVAITVCQLFYQPKTRRHHFESKKNHHINISITQSSPKTMASFQDEEELRRRVANLLGKQPDPAAAAGISTDQNTPQVCGKPIPLKINVNVTTRPPIPVQSASGAGSLFLAAAARAPRLSSWARSVLAGPPSECGRNSHV
jgi:hypothetical protein